MVGSGQRYSETLRPLFPPHVVALCCHPLPRLKVLLTRMATARTHPGAQGVAAHLGVAFRNGSLRTIPWVLAYMWTSFTGQSMFVTSHLTSVAIRIQPNQFGQLEADVSRRPTGNVMYTSLDGGKSVWRPCDCIGVNRHVGASENLRTAYAFGTSTDHRGYCVTPPTD